MTMIRLKIGEQAIELDDDVATFTAGEIAAVERHTGMTLREFGAKLADSGNVSILAWSALAWIGLRRAGTFTPYDVFMDQLKVTDLLAGMTATNGEPLPEIPGPNRAERRRAAGKAGSAAPPVRQGA